MVALTLEGPGRIDHDGGAGFAKLGGGRRSGVERHGSRAAELISLAGFVRRCLRSREIPTADDDFEVGRGEQAMNQAAPERSGAADDEDLLRHALDGAVVKETAGDIRCRHQARLRTPEQPVPVSGHAIVQPIPMWSRDKSEDARPRPSWQLRQDGDGGVRFEVRDAVRDDDVGFRGVGVDPELACEHPTVGALDGNEPKSRRRVALDQEADPPGAEHADAVEQDRSIVDVFGGQRIPLPRQGALRQTMNTGLNLRGGGCAVTGHGRHVFGTLLLL